jgi:hypothetical protein
MSITFVDKVADKVANNALSLTNPTWQGGDLLLALCSSLDTTITLAAYTDIDRAIVPGSTALLAFAARKFAAGSLGGASGDSGASVVFTPAVLGAGHKTAGAVLGFRGCSQSNPINAHTIITPTGTLTFTGANVTATKDNCRIVSALMVKDSVDAFTAAPAAGWTVKASAVFPTGGGQANLWVATKDVDPAAGPVGAVAWTCSAAPGSVEIVTLALEPLSTTQTIVPVADRLVAGGTIGSPNAGAGTLYTNLNQSPAFTKRIIIPVNGEYMCDLSSLNQPDAFTGFGVGYSLEPLGGATSTDWQFKLIQDPAGAAIVHDMWTVAGVNAQSAFVHTVASTDADDIVFTSGKADNLALYAKVTAAS